VKAPPFAYTRASSLEEALERLGEAGPEAKLVAGGQSLIPLLAYRLVRPSHLVDIDSVPYLAAVERRPDATEIGALMRHATLEREQLEGGERLLARAASHIGHFPIRVRGTIGGSLVHADPAAELPVAAVALDAEIETRSAAHGTRRIAAASFFLGPFTTAVAPDEVVTAVRLPATARAASAGFAEFAIRPGDFAIASAAVVASLVDGRVTRARIVLGGVGAIPVAAERAESALEGTALTPQTVREAAALAAADCDTVDDPVASAAYRRRLVERLVADALGQLA
jgi:CO/xanthine dehydrogenase FAD-binding subunit